MLKLLERKSKLEKELNGNVKIFGENISVKVIIIRKNSLKK